MLRFIITIEISLGALGKLKLSLRKGKLITYIYLLLLHFFIRKKFSHTQYNSQPHYFIQSQKVK